MRGGQEGERDGERQQRNDGRDEAADVDSGQGCGKPERRNRAPRHRAHRVEEDGCEGALPLGDGQRPEPELQDAEDGEQVEHQCRKRPPPGPGVRVHPHRHRPGERRRAHDRPERRASSPATPDTDDGVDEPELLRLCERDGAVHDAGGNRADQNHEHRRGGHRDRRRRDGEHGRREDDVQQRQPPRLAVEVRGRPPQRSARRHPFTAAAATPATK